MLDRKRLSIQTIYKQYVLGKEIRQGQSRFVSILATEDDNVRLRRLADQGFNLTAIEVGKTNAAPSQVAPRPSCHAMEIGGAFDAGEPGKRLMQLPAFKH